MLKDLVQVLKRTDPREEVSTKISQMILLASQVVVRAGACFWETPPTDDAKEEIYATDQRINALQQDVRKQLVGRLALSSSIERADFLVIINVIKDIERLGDYAKNLFEAAELVARPLPPDPLFSELSVVRHDVERCLQVLAGILEGDDEAQARILTEQGRVISKRCDDITRRIVSSTLDPAAAVPLALATRYYKRLQKHAMNILSSLLMPLHKLDYLE